MKTIIDYDENLDYSIQMAGDDFSGSDNWGNSSDWGNSTGWETSDDWEDSSDWGNDDGYSSSSSFIQNGEQTSVVSEEGLVDGMTVDNGGSSDTTNSSTSSGQFELSSKVTSMTLELPTESYTSGGKDVKWSLSSDGHTLIGATDDKSIVKISMNEAGEYTTELMGAIDHPPSSVEGDLTINIKVRATDAWGDSDTSIISLVIEDDSAEAMSNADMSLTVGGDPLITTELGNSVELSAKGTLMQDKSGNETIDFGADGGHILKVTIAGNTITYSEDAPIQTVEGENGSFEVNFDTGTYTYTTDSGNYNNRTENITVQVADGDLSGGIKTMNVNLDVTVPPPVVATLNTTSEVTEAGGNITYTVNLTEKSSGNTVVTLDNGQSIIISNGQTTGTVSVVIDSSDDVYNDASSIESHIVDAKGGGFDNLNINTETVKTAIVDTIDETTVSLSATNEITEAGGNVTYTATLTNASQGNTFVTLDNGLTIRIKSGHTSGSRTISVEGDEDAYLDTSVVSASITGARGGNFENLVTDTTAVETQLTDTIDTTTVSLSATNEITEAGGNVTYTATLTNASQGNTFVTLDNGLTIRIKSGHTSGSRTISVEGDEDAYLDTSVVSASITGASGGNFENLVTDTTAVETQLTDTIDETTVSLDATSEITEAGGDIIYTATLTNASQGETVVTLDNGETIIIADGETTGTATVSIEGSEDVYASEEATIISTAISGAEGGNFENLVEDKTLVNTNVTDTIDETIVSLDATSNVEEGGNITYTATLTNASQGETIINLNNGESITITNGNTSGSVDVELVSMPDVTPNVDTVIETIITDANGGNFEQLSVDKTPAITIVDTVVDENEPLILDDNNISIVSEEGLMSGITVDDVGVPDTTNSLTSSGQFNISDSVSNITIEAPTEYFTSQGKGVDWEVSEDGKSLVGSTEDGDIMRVDVSNDGSYTTTLTGVLDHPDLTIEDVLSVPIKINVSDDNGNTESTSLNVVLEDDSPEMVAHADMTLNLGVDPTITNVSFVVDVSSSMSDEDLDLAKEAIQSVVDTYDNLGGVQVNIIQFSGGEAVNSGWINADTANEFILDNTKSGTDISQGLTSLVDSYNEEVPAADQNIVYFFGDGDTYGSFQDSFDEFTGAVRDDNGSIIDTNSDNPWSNFIESGAIDKMLSYSINTPEVMSDIVHLADNGENIVSAEPLAISDISTLSDSISNDVVLSSNGTFMQGEEGNPLIDFGADGGHITSVEVAGNVVVYDESNPIQTVVGENGSFEVNFDDGTYTYYTNSNEYENREEHITIAVVDGDLDGAINTMDVDLEVVVVEPVVLSLDATTEVTEAGEDVIYTAILTQESIGDTVVNLDNGEVITILNGHTTGSVTITLDSSDDVYKDSDSIEASISSTEGGGFDNLNVNTRPVTTQIVDTIDNTVVSLGATSEITEAGADVIYTATLTNASQGETVVTLDNGETIIIADGETTGTATVKVEGNEDVYLDASVVKAAINGAEGGNFENLVADTTEVTTAVNDTIDNTVVSLGATSNIEEGGIITYTAILTNASQGETVVNLNNGESITIGDGNTSGSIDVEFVAMPDVTGNVDVVIETIITDANGGNFEQLTINQTPAVTTVDIYNPLILGEDETSIISEEGLANGIMDDIGNPDDTTNSVTNSGQFNISENASNITLEIPTEHFTSASATIVWELSNDGQTLIGSTENGEVMRVDVATDGSYTTTMTGVIDHPDLTSEDTLTVPVKINVSDDNGNTESTSLNIVVEDDAPVIDADGEASVDLHVMPVTTNLSFVVDISSSMSDEDLALSKEAIQSIIDGYGDLGNVNVNIVQFFHKGTINSGWIDTDTAEDITLDNGHVGTDIAQGLESIVNVSYDGTQPEADQNIVYYFGDGDSYNDDNHSSMQYQTEFDAFTGAVRDDNGDIVSTNPDNAWSNFVESGVIDKLMTYSINTPEVMSDLIHLADNGENNISIDAIAVNNISDLVDAVQNSISLSQTGTLMEDNEGNPIIQFGADGGHITSVVVAGETVLYDAENTIQTVNGENGSFTIDFDNGTYSYTSTSGEYTDHAEKLTVEVVDGDGDGAIGAVDININVVYDESFKNLNPDAVDDHLNIAGVDVIEEPTEVVLLQESFENLGNNESSWHIENGNVIGDHGVVWDTYSNGIEIQDSGLVKISSDGDTHIELDANGDNSNVTMSTVVQLTDSTDYTMSFDVNPRDGGDNRGNEDTSDMRVIFGNQVLVINSDNEGNLTTNNNDNMSITTETLENGWTRFNIDYSDITDNTSDLMIQGKGADDTYGMLLDNIRIVAPAVTDIDTDTTPLVIDDNGVLTINSADILANDSDSDGDILNITDVNIGNNAYGTVSLDENGNVVFVANEYYSGEVTFDYTIDDGHGGTDIATVSFDIDGREVLLLDDTAQTTNISEEGLEMGLVDNLGIGDTTNSTIGRGSFAISDAVQTVSLDIPTDALTSNNEEISWKLSEDGQELIGSTSEGEVVKVNVDNEGNYSTELLGAIDHQDTTVEDQLSMAISVNMADERGNTETVGLNIIIEDDSAVVFDGNNKLSLHVDPIITNVSFVVDISSSMSDADLALSKDAIQQVVDSYEVLGGVNANIIQFYGNNTIESGWVDSDSAREIELDTTKGGTDIEQGLNSLVNNAYNGDEPEADQNIVYFFGDGNTYEEYRTDFDEFTGATRDEDGKIVEVDSDNDWTNFVTSGKVDQLLTYSVNSGTVLSDIEHLADNGENAISVAPVVINDVSQLADILRESVSISQDGDLMTDSDGSKTVSFGADGGHITSLEIAGQVVAYDEDNTVQVIDGTNGSFTVDFDKGTYTYNTETGNYEDYTESIKVFVADGDGDSADSIDLTIDITYDEELKALANNDVPEADVPDADVPEADVPDADVPDADVPEADVPEADVPEADVPDADVPDADVPDADVPDADVPDADVPDADVPDADVPDADADDTTESEVNSEGMLDSNNGDISGLPEVDTSTDETGESSASDSSYEPPIEQLSVVDTTIVDGM